jgi:Uma2 family endonuclease
MANVYTPPPRTMMEVFENLPEGTLAQLINNQIYMSPAPKTIHQIVLAEIFSSLFNYVKEQNMGRTLVSPFDIFLNKKNVFQPDIFFLASKNLTGLKENGFYGAPDLIIEILSPATWNFDKEDKKDVYERSGVKEYWVVDPVSKLAEGYYLENNQFVALPSAEGIINLRLFNLSLRF